MHHVIVLGPIFPRIRYRPAGTLDRRTDDEGRPTLERCHQGRPGLFDPVCRKGLVRSGPGSGLVYVQTAECRVWVRLHVLAIQQVRSTCSTVRVDHQGLTLSLQSGHPGLLDIALPCLDWCDWSGLAWSSLSWGLTRSVPDLSPAVSEQWAGEHPVSSRWDGRRRAGRPAHPAAGPGWSGAYLGQFGTRADRHTTGKRQASAPGQSPAAGPCGDATKLHAFIRYTNSTPYLTLDQKMWRYKTGIFTERKTLASHSFCTHCLFYDFVEAGWNMISAKHARITVPIFSHEVGSGANIKCACKKCST